MKMHFVAHVRRAFSARLVFCLLAALCPLTLGVAASQTKPRSVDLADLTGILAGDYIVVGKKADSKSTYSGRLKLLSHGKALDFTRVVHGRTVRGTATFDTVAGGDRIPVLRMRFTQDGKSYEGTYQWASDYDNYIRFTGYVYLQNGKTKIVGVEMLFPLPPTLRN